MLENSTRNELNPNGITKTNDYHFTRCTTALSVFMYSKRKSHGICDVLTKNA